MKLTSTLKIENDHIGLYPRKSDMVNESEIPLIYILTIPEGNETISISNQHPLAAPIKKQIMDGSPGGNWQYLVAKKGSSMFIIGSINKSKGGRLLFFPSNYSIPVSTDNGSKILDHISFEWVPKIRSHYTFRDGSHLSNGAIKEINQDLTHWFTILISDFSEYIPLPNEIKFSLDWPSSDIQRFTQEGVLKNYRTKSIIDIPLYIEGAHFHQIDCFVGTKEMHATDIPNLTIENICDSKQPEVQHGGVAKIDINDGHSMFVKINEKKGTISSDTLILSSDFIYQ